MDTEGTFLVALAGLAGFLGILLAGVVLATSPGRPLNRRLTAVLFADALFMMTLASDLYLDMGYRVPQHLSYAAMLLMAIAYLLFVASLDTPLSRRLRPPAVLGTLVLLVVAAFILNEVMWYQATPPNATDEQVEAADPGHPWLVIALLSLLALVVSVSAFRRAAKGTPSRRQAAFFALAFGARDLFLFVTVMAWALLDASGAEWLAWRDRTPFVSVFGALLFPLLLAYGILSTQLFDIDLKIKRGISRSTVATVGIIAVFVAAKVAEQYLNRTLGFVAGAVAAGILLFAVPKLNKIGDKVAQAAMPQVHATSEYLSFKKLEVYRAAVESALEVSGRVDEKERAMLDRLQAKLALSPADARAVEAELFKPPEPAVPVTPA